MRNRQKMIMKKTDKNYLIFAVVVLVLLGIAGCCQLSLRNKRRGYVLNLTTGTKINCSLSTCHSKTVKASNLSRWKGWFISDLPVFQRGIPPRFLLIASCPIGFQAEASFLKSTLMLLVRGISIRLISEATKKAEVFILMNIGKWSSIDIIITIRLVIKAITEVFTILMKSTFFMPSAYFRSRKLITIRGAHFT